MKSFTIYHTNDIHMNCAFQKKVHAYLKEHRRPEDLYLDSGDFTDLRDTVVQADKGRMAIGLMNLCGLDCMVVGNNELDLGTGLIPTASLAPFVSANLTDNAGNDFPEVPPYRIFTRFGKRFLVLGLSPYYTSHMTSNGYNVFTTMNDLTIREPVLRARKVLDAMAGEYDFCILLSHSGKTVDDIMLKELPEVDFTFGGHFHEKIIDERYSESGMGDLLGRVVLEIDGDRITVKENVNIDLPEAEDPEYDLALEAMQKKADEILSLELPSLGDLPFDPYKESRLTNFICDCLMKMYDADLAVMHAGISEAALTRPVSRKSLLLNFPSKLNPTLFPVKGSAILEAARLALDDTHIRLDGHGPGFRGHVLGTLGYSKNVRITRAPFSMTVSGVPVDPEKTYRVVADDYLQRGSGYPSLRVPNDLCQYHIWFIRDMVEHFLTDVELYESSMTRREV